MPAGLSNRQPRPSSIFRESLSKRKGARWLLRREYYFFRMETFSIPADPIVGTLSLMSGNEGGGRSVDSVGRLINEGMKIAKWNLKYRHDTEILSSFWSNVNSTVYNFMQYYASVRIEPSRSNSRFEIIKTQ